MPHQAVDSLSGQITCSCICYISKVARSYTKMPEAHQKIHTRSSPLQAFSHICWEVKRFALPWHPPYRNCSHWLLTLLKNQLWIAASHGPTAFGRSHWLAMKENKGKNQEQTIACNNRKNNMSLLLRSVHNLLGLQVYFNCQKMRSFE